MAVVRAHRGCSGQYRRRRAGSLPVLRWLQVGAATAGLGVALVAAPGAQADTGAASSSATSSHEAGPSSDADSSPDTGSGGTEADGGDSSEDPSENPGQDASATAQEDALEEIQSESDETDGSDETAEIDGISSDSGSGKDSLGQLTKNLVDAAAPDETTAADEPIATADITSSGFDDDAANSAEETSGSRSQSTPPAATGEAPGSSGASSVAPTTSEPTALDSTEHQTISVDAVTIPANTPPGYVQSAAESSMAVADSMSQPDYPESVSAPVTWRSMLTESLSWFGLGALALDLPVPQFPVPDLMAGAWVGMRRLHHTYFNSAPRLELSGYTADPWTGVITGNLGGYDADGDIITYTVASAPVHGTVQIADDGTYTYTPDSEFAAAGGTDTFSVLAEDTSAANRWHVHPASLLTKLLTGLGLVAAPDVSAATVSLTGIPILCDTDDDGCGAAPVDHAPSITVHNSSEETIWVYNLTDSGNYSIPTDFQPVKIAKGASAPVTLAVGTGKPGDPENRIYIVEGDKGFTLPVDSTSGIDAFDPTAVSKENSFLNYSFVEYFLYPAHGGYEYTIDTSYIDEWSLPIQFKFDLHGANWSGAVDGKTYGFDDFDTVVSQLNAAGKHLPEGGPYKDLLWSGPTPWGPQPPSSVKRIIGPDKVWSAQSLEPPANFNMNETGWVPKSYQDFVQYGSHTVDKNTIHPYAYNGHEYSTVRNNFDFWRYEVAAPGGTPYPIALRTAAHLDGFPAAHGVYGFFTYPNDESAGQFTNIPNSVSLDIYVHGTSDGVSDSVTEGGRWLYSSSPTRSDADLLKPGRNMLVGTDATDTFILDYLYKSRHSTPLVIAQEQDHDIVAIDKTSLAGAISNEVDIVDCFWFLGGGFANYDSQFIYDRSSGLLYYDQYPERFGYTGVLANLSLSQIDPAEAVFVL